MSNGTPVLTPQPEPKLTPVTDEQAKFIEENARRMCEYTIECLDRARDESKNVLQWLFAVITGGMGLLVTLDSKGYNALAAGTVCAVGAAAYAAHKLVIGTRSVETAPPGNLASSLSEMLDDTPARMRWREAKGIDTRTAKNRAAVERLTTAVDNARIRFAQIPVWFVGGTVATYAFRYLFLH